MRGRYHHGKHYRESFKRAKMDATSDPVVVTVGVGPKEAKTKPQRHSRTSKFSAALVGGAKEWRNPSCLQWINHTNRGTPFSLNKGHSDNVTWMDLEDIVLSEISQSPTDEHFVVPCVPDI